MEVRNLCGLRRWRIKTIVVMAVILVIAMSITVAAAQDNIITALAQLKSVYTTQMQSLTAIITQAFERAEGVFGSSTLAGYRTQYQPVLQAAALIVLAIMLVINLLEELQKGEPTLEMWTKIFITLAISGWLITNSDALFESIDTIGVGIFEATQTAFSDDPNSGQNGGQPDANANAETLNLLSLTSKGDKEADGVALVDEPTLKLLFSDETVEALEQKYNEYIDDPAAWDNDGVRYPEGVTKDSLIQELSNRPPDGYYNINLLHIAAQSVYGMDETWATTMTSSTNLTATMKMANILLMVSLYFMAFALSFQMEIRKLFAPLAIMDVATNGTRGTGMRYIKHYFALYLQKAMYYVIAGIMTGFLQSVRESKHSGAIAEILLYGVIVFVSCGMMKQAGTIANEIVGG